MEETSYLIIGKNILEVEKKAALNISDTLEYDGRPAKNIYVGISDIVEFILHQNPDG